MATEIAQEQSQEIAEFAKAFVAAQAKIEGALKDSTNPHFKSDYADLKSVMDACKSHLNEHGIAIIQRPVPTEAGFVGLSTMLLHTSGQWINGVGKVPMDRTGPQAYGSALTYARRYFLGAIVGVCPVDDDGNGVQGNGNQAAQKPANNPKPATKPVAKMDMDQAEKRMATLKDAFGSRNYDAKTRAEINKRVCEKHAITRVTDLDDTKWAALLQKIGEGYFDPKPKGVAA